jgi:putative flippase GtrA
MFYKLYEVARAFCKGIYLKACEGPFLGPFIRKIDVKFIKFLFVGVINTLFGYSVYAIGITAGLTYVWALLISYILGVLWNFKTTGSLVFKNKDNWLIFKFALVYVATLFVNLICLKLLLAHGLGKYLAQGLLVFPVAVLSFVLFKYLVFKPSTQDAQQKECAR